jgi:hypothetical protein
LTGLLPAQKPVPNASKVMALKSLILTLFQKLLFMLMAQMNRTNTCTSSKVVVVH